MHFQRRHHTQAPVTDCRVTFLTPTWVAFSPDDCMQRFSTRPSLSPQVFGLHTHFVLALFGWALSLVSVFLSLTLRIPVQVRFWAARGKGPNGELSAVFIRVRSRSKPKQGWLEVVYLGWSEVVYLECSPETLRGYICEKGGKLWHEVYWASHEPHSHLRSSLAIPLSLRMKAIGDRFFRSTGRARDALEPNSADAGGVKWSQVGWC